MNLFDFDKPIFKIDKPIRLIELFAGIGAQAKALENLGANFEHWQMCEIDKYAVKGYNAIHKTDFKPSDITKLHGSDLNIIETDKYCYIMTYSFPCVDLSCAGKQRGMGKGTRSGLLWEVLRLLNECSELPQVLLMENVPQVHQKKNIADFQKWLLFLEGKGYCNFWKDLNAKNYGIPQNRNRTFCISILGNYRYEFPLSVPLDKTVYDILENEVDEKYYLKAEVTERLVKSLERKKISNALRCGGGKYRQTPTGFTACGGLTTFEVTSLSDIAHCICESDKKGFCPRQARNGVIECDFMRN